MPDLKINCIISGSETGGAIAVFEEILDPGIGPPRHTHREQNEIFHVIKGTIRFEIDGVLSEIEQGGAALVPAGKVHAFRNIGDQSATIHFEMLPACDSEEAFEKLVSEEIKQFVRDRIAHFKTPQWVTFVDDLPKTATGKVQKFILRGGITSIAKQ